MKKLSITASISVLLLSSQLVHADGIYMTNMTSKLTQDSIDLLTATSRTPGVTSTDEIEFVLSAHVLDQDDVPIEGGPGAYFTAYIPNGVQVTGASFVTGVNGSDKDPDQGGYAANGWGPRAIKSGVAPTFLAPYDSIAGGRVNDLYGDTGIFYSTDTRTKLKLETGDNSNIAIGPTGNPKESSINDPNINGLPVTVTSWKEVEAFNEWDLEQALAFGNSAGVTGGTGVTPYQYGSNVAGPHTGYRYEHNGGTLNSEGPWRRIQYRGSKISKIAGHPVAVPDENGAGVYHGMSVIRAKDDPYLTSDYYPDLEPAHTMGDSMSTVSSSATNAVRWANGYGEGGDTIYVKIKVKMSQVALDADDGVILNFTANGSDSVPGGSKDNHWRYFAPTTAASGDFFIEKKIIKVNDVHYAGGDIAPDSLITYQVRYLNLGNLPVFDVALTDVPTEHINVTGCDAATPTLSDISDGVTASVSAGTKECPDQFATITFNNLPNVPSTGPAMGRLDALRGGTFTYDIRIEDSTVLTPRPLPLTPWKIRNDITMQGNDAVTSLPVTKAAFTTVNIGTPLPPQVADLSVSKVLDTLPPFTSGQTDIKYTIIVKNEPTSANVATAVKVTDIPTNLTVTSATGATLGTTCNFIPVTVLTPSGSIECTIPTLAIDASETITVLATAP